MFVIWDLALGSLNGTGIPGEAWSIPDEYDQLIHELEYKRVTRPAESGDSESERTEIAARDVEHGVGRLKTA